MPTKSYEFSDECLPAAVVLKPDRGLGYPAHQVPGRQRTAYFYRREAIEWARGARSYRGQDVLYPGGYGLWKRLALSYLANYKRLKASAVAACLVAIAGCHQLPPESKPFDPVPQVPFHSHH